MWAIPSCLWGGWESNSEWIKSSCAFLLAQKVLSPTRYPEPYLHIHTSWAFHWHCWQSRRKITHQIALRYQLYHYEMIIYNNNFNCIAIFKLFIVRLMFTQSLWFEFHHCTQKCRKLTSYKPENKWLSWDSNLKTKWLHLVTLMIFLTVYWVRKCSLNKHKLTGMHCVRPKESWGSLLQLSIAENLYKIVTTYRTYT